MYDHFSSFSEKFVLKDLFSTFPFQVSESVLSTCCRLRLSFAALHLMALQLRSSALSDMTDATETLIDRPRITPSDLDVRRIGPSPNLGSGMVTISVEITLLPAAEALSV